MSQYFYLLTYLLTYLLIALTVSSAFWGVIPLSVHRKTKFGVELDPTPNLTRQ